MTVPQDSLPDVVLHRVGGDDGGSGWVAFGRAWVLWLLLPGIKHRRLTDLARGRS